MFRDKTARPRRRRGAAAVEMAITMIPLSMVIMGIFECGRLMTVQEIAVNATREGARLAALSGSTAGTGTSSGATEVNYRVRSYLTAAGISTASATVTVTNLDQPSVTDLTGAGVGDRIQVGVNIPFGSVALTSPWFFGNASIRSTSVMRKEGP